MDKKILLGKRISHLRKTQRLSQETLAERAGISAQYISNIERGKENPTLDLLFSLADALRVSFREMCDLEPVEEMDQKKLRDALRDMLRSAKPEQLRMALQILRAALTQ